MVLVILHIEGNGKQVPPLEMEVFRLGPKECALCADYAH